MNNDAGVAWYEDNHDQFVEIEMRDVMGNI